MIKKNLPLVALALLTAGFFILQAEQKVMPTAGRKPPAILIKCPDIAVTGMQITLVNTLLGDPQVEFPMDTVKLEATLENVGSEPVPPGALLYVILKKNGEAIQSAVGTDNLGAPGSRWTYSVNDSFRHGQKTTYVIQAASTLRECRVNNNQVTRTIDEKKLHPAGNPDLITSIFAVEKRWKREGNRFQAYFDLAADVANSGSGFSNSASRLLFVLNDDQVVLATLNIPQDDLPGPGQKKRFTTELAAQVQRQNKNFLVKETQAGIGPSGILISIKGKKIIDNSSAVEFQVDFLLNPRVILGQVKLDVAKTVVHLGPGLSEFYGTMLAPMLCQSIKALIEKFAEKKLAANLSKVPDSLGKLANPFGAPAGIVLAAGALDIYY